jgi:mannosyl-oligosaccharide alpha-1,2-mannosidase
MSLHSLLNTGQQHLLLSGTTDQSRKMYEAALAAMKRHIFFRPMTKTHEDILFAGNAENGENKLLDQIKIKPEVQHLGCFAGGMVALGAKIFNREEDLATAKRLVNGCLWVYEQSTQGILPEIVEAIPCDDPEDCPWDEDKWIKAMSAEHGIEATAAAAEEKQREIGLPHGILKAKDKRYLLRYKISSLYFQDCVN